MAEFEILYDQGISREGEIIEHGVALDIIEKSGSWYSYKSDRIGQGKENVRDFLKENSDVCNEIEAQIRSKLLPEKSPNKDESKSASENT